MHETSIVIIPAHNEGDWLENTVNECQAAGLTRILVADAGGNTIPPGVRSVEVEAGVGAAMRSAWAYCLQEGWTTSVRVDGDGQHAALAAARMLALAEGGEDYVLGQRFDVDLGRDVSVPLDRRMMNIAMRELVNTWTGYQLLDVLCGMVALRETAMKFFANATEAEGYGLPLEMLMVSAAARRYPPVTVPFTPRYNCLTEQSIKYSESPISRLNRMQVYMQVFASAVQRSEGME